jgi:hypothetical protein
MRLTLPVVLASCSALLTGCGELGLATVTIADGAAIVAVAPTGEIRFEDASPDGRSKSEEVTIGSDGDVAVYVADVWVETDDGATFFLNEDLPFPKNMEPGEAIPITLRFQPPRVGDFHGTLLIESGTDGTVLERPLFGTGCADDDGNGSC